MAKIKILETTTKEMMEQYQAGIGLNELSKRYGYAPQTIKKRLTRRGISIRTSDEQASIENKKMRFSNRKYDLKHDYFESWSNNMAYILGLLFTDGNLHKNRMKIVLKAEDGYLLEAIKSEMGYTGKVFYSSVKRFNKDTAKLDICSLDLRNSLNRLGLNADKTFNMSFPTVPKDYELDFIRGVFDGDGFTKKGKYLRAGFCSGSKPFLDELNTRLQSYGLSERTVSKHSKAECYYIEYSSKECRLLYDLLYGRGGLHLVRKRLVFEQHL